MEACVEAKKPLFVGEFGVPENDSFDGDPRQEHKEILDAIVECEVPLAAIWVFDLPMQENFINISPTNHRAYLLDELTKANERLQRKNSRR